MIVTEVEAHKLWCPQSQVAESAADDIVSNTLSGKHVTCAGSGCMAWRWAMKRNPDWKPDHSMMMAGYETHPDDRKPTHIKDTKSGYCGLAGRP